MKPLKDQFDEAAKQHALAYEQRNAARWLGHLQAAVQEFRDEGFTISLDVRPEKIGGNYFAEAYGSKILFNGEVTAEGQRIDFAIYKGASSSDGMQFKMSWGGEHLFYAGASIKYEAGKNGYVDQGVSVAGKSSNAYDEYGDDPAPMAASPAIEAALRDALMVVLVKNAAAAKFNVAPGAPDKNFKVPATIKLSNKGGQP
jgi:hypothetical protein